MPSIEQAVHAYYLLRQAHKRPIPRKLSAERKSRDSADMNAFLGWAKERGIEDPVSFMRSRFETVYRASHKRAVPRISQLKNDAHADRWLTWLEGETAAARADAEMLAAYDELSREVHNLACPPLIPQEKLKRRYREHPDLCMIRWQHTGGYHPKSNTCQQCPNAVRCAAHMNNEFNFDVGALRAGDLSRVPVQIASAYLRA